MFKGTGLLKQRLSYNNVCSFQSQEKQAQIAYFHNTLYKSIIMTPIHENIFHSIHLNSGNTRKILDTTLLTLPGIIRASIDTLLESIYKANQTCLQNLHDQNYIVVFCLYNDISFEFLTFI